jgi:hypothetical protein
MAAPARPPFRVGSEPWVAFRPGLDAMLEPLGDAVLARLLPRTGSPAVLASVTPSWRSDRRQNEGPSGQPA